MRLTSKTSLLLTLGASMVGACTGAEKSTTPPVEQMPPPAAASFSIGSVAPAAEGAMFWAPLDATPSPQGETIYFTASTAEGPAVLATSGGEAPTTLYAGELLSAPFGVVTSLDGSTLFISDSAIQETVGEETEEIESDAPAGAILTLSVTGGDPTIMLGTAGTSPRSLTLNEIDGQDVLHFTGIDPATGAPAVFRIGANGGSLAIVASGEPLAQPSGIVVGSDGTIYIADSSSVAGGEAALLMIKDGVVSPLVESLRLGYPAGITLNMAGTVLLASGLADDADTSVVHSVELSSGERTMISDGIGHNSESGGVHRAHKVDAFAWANSDGDENNPGGTVYLLKAAE